MAAKAYVDHVEDMSAKIRNGVIVGLRRKIRVKLDADQTNRYANLFAALAATGVPADGSSLPEAPDLICTERNPSLVEKDKRYIDIEVVYEHFFGDNQNLTAPPLGFVYGEGSTSLGQETSNLDVDGVPVTLQHTYPSDDPDYPDLTKTQGGEFPFLAPQPTIRVPGIQITDFPELIRGTIVHATNAVTWNGTEPGTWICSSCTYRPCNAGSEPQKFFFNYEFQFKDGGWDPTAVFLDDRTKTPPVGLVQDVGYKTVRKYPRVNFEEIMGARFAGQ